MPELPDVEGFRIELAETLPGRTIDHVRVHDPGVLRNTTTRSFQRALRGRTFAEPRRHGKWLLLPTDDNVLLVHSGMTGRPYYVHPGAAPQRFDRVTLELDDGEFRFNDLRKLRGLWVASDEDAVCRIVGESGPDALQLTTAQLTQALRGLRRALKPALMDQTVVAGLGNLLTDEIAWQARISPIRGCADLDEAELARLGATMRRVLRTSVRHRCVPALRGWLTSVRDEALPACPRCGTPLRSRRMNGRRTLWCPHCQPH